MLINNMYENNEEVFVVFKKEEYFIKECEI